MGETWARPDTFQPRASTPGHTVRTPVRPELEPPVELLDLEWSTGYAPGYCSTCGFFPPDHWPACPGPKEET